METSKVFRGRHESILYAPVYVCFTFTAYSNFTILKSSQQGDNSVPMNSCILLQNMDNLSRGGEASSAKLPLSEQERPVKTADGKKYG